MEAKEFWEKIFSEENSGYYKSISYNLVKMPNLEDPVLSKALEYFDDIKNKTIIDLGCGKGMASIFFAYHGANVISVDYSSNAIQNLTKYCKEHNIPNITPMKLSALELDKINQVDFIYGEMILHHIEPFKQFAEVLSKVIKVCGKGFFYENNARSNLMMYFRNNLVGKLWVPKHGDKDEHPLSLSEIKILKKYFKVKIEFPELFYFRLISTYLLNGYFKKFFILIDKLFFHIKPLKKYSYRQYIYLS